MFTPATEPLVFFGVFRQPRVGRGDHKQSARKQSGANLCQEQCGIVEPIDQVACKDKVVVAVERLEVAGIALHKGQALAKASQPECFQRYAAGEREVAFDWNLVMHLFALLQAHARLNESRREVHSIDV